MNSEPRIESNIYDLILKSMDTYRMKYEWSILNTINVLKLNTRLVLGYFKYLSPELLGIIIPFQGTFSILSAR